MSKKYVMPVTKFDTMIQLLVPNMNLDSIESIYQLHLTSFLDSEKISFDINELEEKIAGIEIDKRGAKQIISFLQNHFNL